MRTIRFRGKCAKDSKYAGEWVEGGLLQCEKSKDVLIVYSITDTCSCTYHVDPATVGQFTGLTDRNGKEIYEGDIIKVREYENLLMKEFSDEPDRFDMFTLEEIRGELLKEYISPVVFDEGGFLIATIQGSYDMWLACLFGDMKRSSPSFDFEVIGNIHDNPDLIEKGGEE